MITELKPNEVFVFGSNLAGRHGAGAALMAREKFGAEYGVGHGPTGQCFAIPTKDHRMKVLPLEEIGVYVQDFLLYAWKHPEKKFLVTLIGCGLAGYKPESIRPLFQLAAVDIPYNVILPKEFQ